MTKALIGDSRLLDVRWLICVLFSFSENGEEDLGVDVVWLVCDVVASQQNSLCRNSVPV